MASKDCCLPLPGNSVSCASNQLPGLDQWVQEHTHVTTTEASASPGLRFAFYGRVSTEDHQDPATSRGWQLLRAQALTSGYGHITTEYFDIGRSRSTPWPRRPEAAALLAALADPDRGFDAIVIGSSERAFHGNQFTVLAPLFDHYKIPVWIPELGGAADPQTAGHEELMVLLGILAKREVARARMRALTSMTVQARDQGRFLGGRPPYGYRLTDAGPHPNRGLARRGVRAHRLVPDPTTGPVVTWIFTQRLAGHSMARIARALNHADIPCPSAADPARNPHRNKTAWNATVVRAILANPRYTGRQVWNRQRTDHVLLDPANTTLGSRDVRRWNTPENWSVSTAPAHRALVSEADFVAVQNIRAPRETASGRAYLLVGLLRCALCQRQMDSCWSHQRPAYRCRHGYTTATSSDRPRNAYVREDRILPHLPALAIRLGLAAPGAASTSPADIVTRLRTSKITLTYDPKRKTLTASTPTAERIFIG
ncbi:recombinase family protein [Streptomyces sp. NPDC001339]|uniref:recombinase family protein n=1 Tax=Streptomyces sp. NPDC001339 TaxID=3364563 RepID=UPI0036BDE47A